ncbi:protein with 3 transmembrane domains [Cryptosporidium sp. chipmunk genotype I]|uniref:protein with 3 transmembrane domains n=1 Tax=Cryptosporidium sp. chipmunk genotype I TaxID=1280935 RepID=UPI00351A5DDA|nr:protein with 3 transmembrane domains [Cryptosporidium sp. chipmunk genotype I]
MPNTLEVSTEEIAVMRNNGFETEEENNQLNESIGLRNEENIELTENQRITRSSQNEENSGESINNQQDDSGNMRLIKLWRKYVEKVRECLIQLEYNSRAQLPLIKFVLRIFIILSLTILPLINEINTVTPLLSVFLRESDWFLIPMSMNKHAINNDLLLRINQHEYNMLLQRKNYQQKANNGNFLGLMNSYDNNGLFSQNSKFKKSKNNYNSNVCINKDARLLIAKEASSNYEQLSLLVPSIWCPVANLNNEFSHVIYNTRREVKSRKVKILYMNKDENTRNNILGFTSLKMHKNTYRYRPTKIFKIISTSFVVVRWFMLISRMVLQLWSFNTFFPGTESGNNINSVAQFQFIQEFKSLVSFSIFYIWSLSCVYLLFGLTTSKCSVFPKIAIHEKVQWLLWACVLVTTICFYTTRLPYFDHHEDASNSNSSENSSGSSSSVNNENNNQVEEENYRSKKRKIFIQHILSVISCCGFGFSLSGSVLLLSTRITSPWVNSCFITIISQSLDLLLRGYLGLIIDHHNLEEKKIRYYKYVFPSYLLKDEEKIHCNNNGQREWVVKCNYNSQPPPLIFKHSFISISLTKISSTFFSLNNFSNNEDSTSYPPNNASQTINCMICYENPSNIVFSPCLHSGICDNCIDELMKWTVCKLKKIPCCHLCRSPIEIAWQLNPNESNSNENNYFSEKCTEVIYPKLQIYDDSNEKSNL